MYGGKELILVVELVKVFFFVGEEVFKGLVSFFGMFKGDVGKGLEFFDGIG